MILLLGFIVLWAWFAKHISPLLMVGYLFLLLVASTVILEILLRYQDNDDWKGSCYYVTCVASL